MTIFNIRNLLFTLRQTFASEDNGFKGIFINMQILCTGATGLVGYNFIKAAAEAGHKVTAVCGTRELPQIKNVEALKCDLLDEHATQRLVLDVFPQIIVNCAAISSPTDVDTNPELAEKMNTRLPERLAVLANHVSARLIHLSTDMVFDGSCPPYKNTDIPMPCTLYGTTKLMAEKAVLKVSPSTTVVLRLSHVSGNSLTGRRSLHEKLLLNWSLGKKLKLRTDEIKCPLSAERLAEMLVEICERPNLSGIYHYAGLEPVSRYDMGARIAKYFGLNPAEFIEPVQGDRPMNLTMDMSCLAARTKNRSCMFDELLPEMKVPPDLEAWLKSKSGKTPVKRYKL